MGNYSFEIANFFFANRYTDNFKTAISLKIFFLEKLKVFDFRYVLKLKDNLFQIFKERLQIFHTVRVLHG